MRILITGGAGCLGSNLIEHWLPQGHAILVIDNFATGKREVLPNLPRLDLVEASISDFAAVERAFAAFQPTHVVHAAASYKDPFNWREDAATNVIGTIHVVEASRRHSVHRFINFQTVLCYGRTDVIPIPVDHPLRPFTSYGISKVAAEQYVSMSGLSFASLRLANVTGPRLSIGPIPTFYKRLKAQQPCFCTKAQRDFLDMSDFLNAVDALMPEDAPVGVFNVSSGVGHSVKEIYAAARRHLGLPPDPDVKLAPIGDDDVAAVVPCPALTITTLGWRPRMTFEETLQRTFAWYDAHGVNDVFSHLAAQEA